MKDTRIILLLLSLILIGTWVFHFYDKKNYTRAAGPVPASKNDTSAALLQQQQKEINQLRSELETALNKQQKDSVTEMLKTDSLLINDQPIAANPPVPERTETKKSGESTPATLLKASGIRIAAVPENGNKQIEAKLADQTAGFIVSFSVYNALTDFNNTDVYLVLKKPNGRLLVKDVWETSGSINTINSGKVQYTQKLRFDYQKGETKTLRVELAAEEYEKGIYTLQLYQNGYLIGQARKNLG